MISGENVSIDDNEHIYSYDIYTDFETESVVIDRYVYDNIGLNSSHLCAATIPLVEFDFSDINKVINKIDTMILLS
jgi:hypothetical protein